MNNALIKHILRKFQYCKHLCLFRRRVMEENRSPWLQGRDVQENICMPVHDVALEKGFDSCSLSHRRYSISGPFFCKIG